MRAYKFHFTAFLIAALMGSATAAYAEAGKKSGQTFVFGIVPQQSGSKLSELWSPILKYLEEETGYTLRFATARNIPTFAQRLGESKYDFAYMNPQDYARSHDASGYEAFAKAKGLRLQGILVVHKDSKYRDLKDLEGEVIALPAHAFAASEVMQAQFNKVGVSIQPKFVSSHESVYRNVAEGLAAAGGGVMRTFQNTSPEYRDQLRILWTSEKFTPHAFAAHPRVPPEAVQKLQTALMNMDKSPKGKELLKTLRMEAIEAANDKEWDDVRSLKLD